MAHSVSFIIVVTTIIVIYIAMLIFVLHHRRKVFLSNKFRQKDDADVSVLFKRFVMNLNDEFETESYVEFIRLDRDDDTTYTMSHELFKEKFISEKDYRKEKI